MKAKKLMLKKLPYEDSYWLQPLYNAPTHTFPPQCGHVKERVNNIETTLLTLNERNPLSFLPIWSGFSPQCLHFTKIDANADSGATTSRAYIMPPIFCIPKVNTPSSCINPKAGINKNSTHETDIPNATSRNTKYFFTFLSPSIYPFPLRSLINLFHRFVYQGASISPVATPTPSPKAPKAFVGAKE